MQQATEQATEPQAFKRMRVAEVQRESSVIKSFVLEAADGTLLPAFLPGQFVQVRITGSDGQRLLRHYSLSGDPAERTRWRISVKHQLAPSGRSELPDGLVSSHLHGVIEAAATLDVAGPAGAFVLDELSDRPVVLLSGGVGVTPMLSMLHRLCATSRRRVYFIHACENGAVHAFRDEVARLQASREGVLTHICYRMPESLDVAGQCFDSHGLITRETMQRLLPLDDYDVYLCGPTRFMQTNFRLLRSLGVEKARIRHEFFGPASVLEPEEVDVPSSPEPSVTSEAPEASVPTVCFMPSGKTVAWDPSCHSLLDFAEAAGLKPPFSCRAGLCGSCASQLIDGTVEYFEQPLDEPRDGELLLCCARPSTAVTIQIV
ncbi:Flavohemoprotein (plasmid) [Caballeronia sp. SBC1]|uniref:2Fe-2S iron-sulfur cluster-binding protein n=1 Tax=unclassified Caballeronia TaxID=2646786 RepID=UPI0013E14771|nr:MULTISPECIES: 2Fe-2S iron-sulfur cluster-binding protein [unclassified Caballeronia]QIE28921.1 Flavohemoprotein [Caballeronia sp. SBC2]QIN66976.1 Flavohemoprotein [Caballeronia sp. SBC1]